MPNRLQPLNVFDFTGGLNLRPETFQLMENEFPDVLNLEPDARGGLHIRKGWDYWGEDDITPGGVWNPRNAFLHINSDGSHRVLVANQDGRLFSGQNGIFNLASAATVNAFPHAADFVSWSDTVRIACGRIPAPCRFNAVGNTITVLTPSEAGNWQNDYTNPGTGTNQPKSEVIAQHAGYLFVGNTHEGGSFNPNRIRWSHPNNPNAWNQNDYIDITEGGDSITAMVPFVDRLLVFKPDSVWALFGYNAETWELTNISRQVGCVHQQAIARSEGACFFLSWPQGVFAYTERQGVQEISVNLRSLFIDNALTYGGLQNIWLGWMNRRLWVSLPWLEDKAATDEATSAFVFDPEVGDGAWTKFRGADGCVPGPYMEKAVAGQDIPLLAFCRLYPHAMILDAREDGKDIVHDQAMGFRTRIRTAWLDAGAPTHRKSWRRPDFIMRGVVNETNINITVFHNFDHVNPERAFQIKFSPATQQKQWGQFQWNDGTQWGRGAQTAAVERGSSMGRAGAVQLVASGEPGKPWGFNGIILKYIARRFR